MNNIFFFKIKFFFELLNILIESKYKRYLFINIGMYNIKDKNRIYCKKKRKEINNNNNMKIIFLVNNIIYYFF